MLDFNIAVENITKEKLTELALTIKFEEFDMRIEDTKKSIKRLNKKIENKSGKFTVKEVDGFKEKKETLEKDLDEYKKTLESCKNVHDKVITSICSVVSEHGKKNNPESVRNLLRIIAGADCKLLKHAIKIENREDIFDNFEFVAHCDCNEDGNSIQSKALKEAYKKANESIEKLFKDMLSIEVANEYTGVIRIRFRGKKLQKLHQMYVKDVKPVYDTDKNTGISKYNGDKTTTLIATRKTKDGKVTHNFSMFAEKVCELTVEFLSK